MTGRAASVVVVALGLLAAQAAGEARAPGHAAAPRRCFLVLVPTLTPREVLEARGLPGLRWWRERGALGLMNTRALVPRLTPREAERVTADPARGGAYLTLGAGTRCTGALLGGEAYGRAEPVENGTGAELYRRRNLLDPRRARVLQVNALALHDANARVGYTAVPGALGSLLRRAGLEAAALGDADRGEEPHREAFLVAMDTAGRVTAGPDGPLSHSSRSREAPFGLRADPDRLLESLRNLERRRPRAALFVVDWGDAARLDDYRRWMTDAAYAATRARVLADLDRFLQGLRTLLRPESDLLLLLSPHPGREARRGFDLLAPVLASPARNLPPSWGPPGSNPAPGPERGLLTSATTRRPGIVANTDVAPTVAALLGLSADPSMVGRPMAALARPRPVETLSDLHARLLAVEVQRRNLLRRVLDTWRWGMALLAAWALFGAARWASRTAYLLGLALLALPVAVLGGGALPALSLGGYGVYLAAVTAALALAAGWAARRSGWGTAGPFLLSLLLVLGTLWDGLHGFVAMPYTILSYSVMEGARYYGIGNEFMGSLIAAALIAAGGVVSLSHRLGGERRPWTRHLGLLLAAGLFGLTALVLAGPSWGAKFGGAITASLAFSYALWRLSGRRVTARLVLWCGLALGVVVALVIGADLLRGGQSSHVGRLVHSVRELGWGELLLVFQRKWQINYRLLVYSPWSRLMQLALLPCALYALRGWLRARGPAWLSPPEGEAWPKGPEGAALEAVLLAALIAFLVNDAGVLAAATALIYVPVGLAAAAWDRR